MKTKTGVTPFITLCGDAEEAIQFYLSIFKDSKLIDLTHYQNEAPGIGETGKVLNASIELKGETLMFMDIAQDQGPEFSWAISLFVSCDSEEEFDHLFGNFADGGFVVMGPEPIMNLRKVAWVTDRFKITWQLVWA